MLGVYVGGGCGEVCFHPERERDDADIAITLCRSLHACPRLTQFFQNAHECRAGLEVVRK